MRTLAAILGLFALSAPHAAAQPLERLTLEELERRIEERDLGKLRVLAAEQAGEIVYRRRFDGKSFGQPIDVRSAGKSLTALAVGMAIDDGLLPGTDLAVWPYLDKSRGEPFDSITIDDLLGMSSALDCDDWDRSSPGWEERMYRKNSWLAFVLALPARAYARDERGEGPFSYCTAGVFLLGQVVEKAAGERFDLYLQRRLFEPLGITTPGWKRSRSGEIQSGGQIAIADDALLKIGRLVLSKGVWSGNRIVSEDWVETMLSPRHKLGEHVFYGNLWWSTPVPSPRGYEGAWMMKGNGGNIIAIVPSYDAVLVVQSENYNREDAERYSFMALAAMIASLEPPTAE